MNAQQVLAIGAFKQFWNGANGPAGLVLAWFVQTLVRVHGGEVQIESEPGMGMRVRVMVPSK